MTTRFTIPNTSPSITYSTSPGWTGAYDASGGDKDGSGDAGKKKENGEDQTYHEAQQVGAGFRFSVTASTFKIRTSDSKDCGASYSINETDFVSGCEVKKLPKGLHEVRVRAEKSGLRVLGVEGEVKRWFGGSYTRSTYDDDNPAFNYDAAWTKISGAPLGEGSDDGMYYDGAARVANGTGRAQFAFQGEAVWLYGQSSPSGGRGRVWVDGKEMANLNMQNDWSAYSSLLFFTADLDPQTGHTLTFDSLGGGEVVLDYAVVGASVPKTWMQAHLLTILGTISGFVIVILLALIGTYTFQIRRSRTRLNLDGSKSHRASEKEGWRRMPEYGNDNGSYNEAALGRSGSGRSGSVNDWRKSEGYDHSPSHSNDHSTESGNVAYANTNVLNAGQQRERAIGVDVGAIYPSYVPYVPPNANSNLNPSSTTLVNLTPAPVSSGNDGSATNLHWDSRSRSPRPPASPGYLPYNGPVELVPPTQSANSNRNLTRSPTTSSQHTAILPYHQRSPAPPYAMSIASGTSDPSYLSVQRPTPSRQNSGRSLASTSILHDVPLVHSPGSYSETGSSIGAGGGGRADWNRNRYSRGLNSATTSMSMSRAAPLSAVSGFTSTSASEMHENDTALIRTASRGGQRLVARLWPSRAAVPSDYLTSMLERYHSNEEDEQDVRGGDGVVGTMDKAELERGHGNDRLPPSSFKGDRLRQGQEQRYSGDVEGALAYMASMSTDEIIPFVPAKDTLRPKLTVVPRSVSNTASSAFPSSRAIPSSGALPSSVATSPEDIIPAMTLGGASQSMNPNTSASASGGASTNPELRRGVSIKSAKTPHSLFSTPGSALGLDIIGAGRYRHSDSQESVPTIPMTAGMSDGSGFTLGGLRSPMFAPSPASVSASTPAPASASGPNNGPTTGGQMPIPRTGLRIHIPGRPPTVPTTPRHSNNTEREVVRNWVIELDPNTPMTSVSRPQSSWRG